MHFLSAVILLISLSLLSVSSPLSPSKYTTFSHSPSYDGPLTIDTFSNNATNALGHWHGPQEALKITTTPGSITLYPTDPDQAYHTQLSSALCFNLVPYKHRYLHVVFSGPAAFDISLTQHNDACDPSLHPYPETWDTVEAARYQTPSAIYIPLSHFNIDLHRVVSIGFSGFYTTDPVTFYRVALVTETELPASFRVPTKLPSGTLNLRCTVPNSFAFGIDDGRPEFANRVMQILEEEGILVTFFVVGMGIQDPETNFSSVYAEMKRRGHQIALHSETHRKLESLPSTDEIDDEITRNIQALKDHLGIESRYFRPPYGTVGARTRQRLASHLPEPHIINWSVDIEDWLWANTSTPERQLEAFYRDVRQGGNLAVMHFVSESTVDYLVDVIRFVKRLGLRVMRVDQCLGDLDLDLGF
ncbi:glycoside hydrolase/deacetylase [Aspergillus steynii IBT 23096]|uniref:Glycoside hydrolase/deacetylase n=1 Tax=Aspergillus steynii IBT 23096 TaxID=1392250 RepID=A0A2I2GI38_9EURO|nr:glycoside hydrolase/deacetylase [Aspergillus steynii IBT 23096]PLB52545.1 glycoside hydrolase/deacetylase [Aspergillus steynii IBT 23096]